MQKYDKKFRGHLGGFNKSDVNNYIKKTDMLHSAEIEELNSKLDEAEKKAKAIEDEKSGLSVAFDTLAEKTRALENEKNALSAENKSLRERIASLEAELHNSASDTARAYAAEGAETDKKTPATATEKERTRLGFLEDGSLPPDEVIDTAEFRAKNLIISAERECEAKRTECDAVILKIRSQTEEQAHYIRDRLAKTAGSLLSNVNTDLNESIESCIRELKSCVDDMETEVTNLLAKMSSRSEEMNERITYYRNYLSDGIEETMRQIKKKADGEHKDA